MKEQTHCRQRKQNCREGWSFRSKRQIGCKKLMADREREQWGDRSRRKCDPSTNKSIVLILTVSHPPSLSYNDFLSQFPRHGSCVAFHLPATEWITLFVLDPSSVKLDVCAHLFLTAILLLQIWWCRFVLQPHYTSICHLSVRAVLRAVIDSLLLPSLFMTVKAQSRPYHFHTWAWAEWHDSINCLMTEMCVYCKDSSWMTNIFTPIFTLST